jgi:hypothetical protein
MKGIDMKDTNTAIFENMRFVDDTASYMRKLSNAAYAMGQDRLADDLSIMAGDLQESAKAVQVAYSNDLNDEINRSQKAIGETFKAALDSCLPN